MVWHKRNATICYHTTSNIKRLSLYRRIIIPRSSNNHPRPHTKNQHINGCIFNRMEYQSYRSQWSKSYPSTVPNSIGNKALDRYNKNQSHHQSSHKSYQSYIQNHLKIQIFWHNQSAPKISWTTHPQPIPNPRTLRSKDDCFMSFFETFDRWAILDIRKTQPSYDSDRHSNTASKHPTNHTTGVRYHMRQKPHTDSDQQSSCYGCHTHQSSNQPNHSLMPGLTDKKSKQRKKKHKNIHQGVGSGKRTSKSGQSSRSCTIIDWRCLICNPISYWSVPTCLHQGWKKYFDWPNNDTAYSKKSESPSHRLDRERGTQAKNNTTDDKKKRHD